MVAALGLLLDTGKRRGVSPTRSDEMFSGGSKNRLSPRDAVLRNAANVTSNLK
jgi:hypothetical protein